jgi:ABC-2 type transport system permease protein
MNMFVSQWRAECVRILRSPFFLLFSIVMPFVFYFLFAELNGADTPIGGTTWAAYFLMSMTAFSLIGSSVSQFGIRLAYERKGGWMRQLALTPLPMTTLVAAKIASQLVVHGLIIALLFPVAGAVYGLQLTATQWLACAAWLWLGSVPFLAIGAWIGTIRSPEAATALSNIVFMGMAVAGGLWMPLSVMPAWLQAVGRWMPSWHYAGGAWSILAGEPVDWASLLS